MNLRRKGEAKIYVYVLQEEPLVTPAARRRTFAKSSLPVLARDSESQVHSGISVAQSGPSPA